jgi:hypothetical protein
MTARCAWIALAAAGALGLAACADNDVGPAGSGGTSSTGDRSGPATAGAPTGAPQGSNSSGQPVNPRTPPADTPPATGR